MESTELKRTDSIQNDMSAMENTSDKKNVSDQPAKQINLLEGIY